MKRIASIQDISCLGRCSLTVALPVISALGVECAIVPTAVLSAHTAFPGVGRHPVIDAVIHRHGVRPLLARLCQPRPDRPA